METEVRQLLPSGLDPARPVVPRVGHGATPQGDGATGDDCDWQTFALPSEPGNERPAMQEVADAEKELKLPEQVRKRLKSAKPKEGRY
jgi:hypothetical protein